jgi:hypothetical protein
VERSVGRASLTCSLTCIPDLRFDCFATWRVALGVSQAVLATEWYSGWSGWVHLLLPCLSIDGVLSAQPGSCAKCAAPVTLICAFVRSARRCSHFERSKPVVAPTLNPAVEHNAQPSSAPNRQNTHPTVKHKASSHTRAQPSRTPKCGLCGL